MWWVLLLPLQPLPLPLAGRGGGAAAASRRPLLSPHWLPRAARLAAPATRVTGWCKLELQAVVLEVQLRRLLLVAGG